MLSKEAVEEFQKIYKETFGIELSYEDAAEQGHNLLRFIKFVCKDNNAKDVE
jgi:hypothetical protein